jgi:cbb3-type cytochrome oxidase subunit 3
MSGLFLMYGFISGILAVLITVYICVICSIYNDYRKRGLTRKQATLATWAMKDE